MIELMFAVRRQIGFVIRRFASRLTRLVAAASVTALLPFSASAQRQMHLGQRCTTRDYFRVEPPDTSLPRPPLLGVKRVYIDLKTVTNVSATTLDAYTAATTEAFRNAGFEIATASNEDRPGTATVNIYVDTPSRTNRSATIIMLTISRPYSRPGGWETVTQGFGWTTVVDAPVNDSDWRLTLSLAVDPAISELVNQNCSRPVER